MTAPDPDHTTTAGPAADDPAIDFFLSEDLIAHDGHTLQIVTYDTGARLDCHDCEKTLVDRDGALTPDARPGSANGPLDHGAWEEQIATLTRHAGHSLVIAGASSAGRNLWSCLNCADCAKAITPVFYSRFALDLSQDHGTHDAAALGDLIVRGDYDTEDADAHDSAEAVKHALMCRLLTDVPREVLAAFYDQIAEGFDQNAREYEKTGASDPDRQYAHALHARALARQTRDAPTFEDDVPF